MSFTSVQNLDKLNRPYQVLLAPGTNSGAEIEIAAPFRTPQLKLNCDQDPKSNHPRLERSTAIGPLKQVGSLGCYGSFMSDVTQEGLPFCDTRAKCICAIHVTSFSSISYYSNSEIDLKNVIETNTPIL